MSINVSDKYLVAVKEQTLHMQWDKREQKYRQPIMQKRNADMYRNIIKGVNPGGGGCAPQFLEWGRTNISNYPPVFNMFNEILFFDNLKT
jgi:hypothetical protein